MEKGNAIKFLIMYNNICVYILLFRVQPLNATTVGNRLEFNNLRSQVSRADELLIKKVAELNKKLCTRNRQVKR